MRILLVEDHPTLGQDLKKGLERCQYVVDLTASTEDALARASEHTYDLIILDLLSQDLQGSDICQRLRTEHKDRKGSDQEKEPQILCLTALNRIDHNVKGLMLGADDYLLKPFAFSELEARVQTLLERDGSPEAPVLHFMDITLDTRTHEVWRGRRSIALSSKEYALLDLFMHHPQHILSRTTIAEHVWDYDADHLANVIDIYIHYLRSKLCAEGEPDVIHAVNGAHGTRGAGYQLKESTP